MPDPIGIRQPVSQGQTPAFAPAVLLCLMNITATASSVGTLAHIGSPKNRPPVVMVTRGPTSANIFLGKKSRRMWRHYHSFQSAFLYANAQIGEMILRANAARAEERHKLWTVAHGVRCVDGVSSFASRHVE